MVNKLYYDDPIIPGTNYSLVYAIKEKLYGVYRISNGETVIPIEYANIWQENGFVYMRKIVNNVDYYYVLSCEDGNLKINKCGQPQNGGQRNL